MCLLCFCCVFVMFLICFCYAFGMCLLGFCFAFVMLLLCFCYAFGMLLLCFCYAFFMLLLCFCFAFAMLLRCFCYAFAMLLLCFCHAFAMFLLCRGGSACGGRRPGLPDECQAPKRYPRKLKWRPRKLNPPLWAQRPKSGSQGPWNECPRLKENSVFLVAGPSTLSFSCKLPMSRPPEDL